MRISESVNSLDIQDALFPLNWVLGAIGLVLLAAYLYLYFKTPWFELNYGASLKEFLSFRPFGLRRREREWRRLAKRFEQGERGEALADAHAMLADTLKRLGFGGINLEAQIAEVPEGVLLRVPELLQTIRLTESVKENPHFPVPEDAGEKALDSYKMALTDLEIL